MSGMTKHILVTGGSGFIGSNLVMELQNRFPEDFITILEDFRSSSFKNLLGFKGDVLAYNCAGMQAGPGIGTTHFGVIYIPNAVNSLLLKRP